MRLHYRHHVHLSMASYLDVFFIVGCIFSLVGATFTSIGIALLANFEWLLANGTGDVVILPVISLSLGLLTLVIGLYLCFRHLKKSQRIKALIAQNYYVMADIVSVQDDWSIRYNNRPTYVVNLSYKDPVTGNQYFFRSRNLIFDPERLFTADHCRVYLDRNYTYDDAFGVFPDGWREDAKYYYVDIDSVLNLM